MPRDVTLRGTMAELVGDETYELWLKHESEDWILEAEGDVDVDEASQQDFLLESLVTGDDYVAQIRLKRASRYRAGYLTADPDTWPESSRCEFTPGALEGVDAPEMVSGVWTRTATDATNIALQINAFDLTKDLKVFRNGVEIGVIEQPHVNPVAFVDLNPPLAEEHLYTAAHTVGFLDGPESLPLPVFAGPLPPLDFELVSAIDHYGSYTVAWDADGDVVRLQDDFLCTDVFVAAIGGDGTTTDSTREITKEVTELPEGDTQAVTFHARIRREIDHFAVIDVSDWADVLVQMLIDDDNADYNSCP